MNLPELIEISRRNVRYEMPPNQVHLINVFNKLDLPVTDWRGWIYHVPMPKDTGITKYVDTKIDPNRFDYEPIVAHAVKRGRAILVNEKLYAFNPLEPMYERCRAMCAYVHSHAFNSPTVFLDGDAFVNTDLTAIFKAIKDVAVTYRLDLGLMPINEGVIFVKPTEGTRSFFRAYLATYENLAKVPEIVDYYGSDPGIKRWRGGQLSLNALTCPEGVISEMDRMEVAGCTVQYLPCETWNKSLDMDQSYAHAELDTKAVLHQKGPRKAMSEQIMAYQNAR
jgi:hypothetical protein